LVAKEVLFKVTIKGGSNLAIADFLDLFFLPLAFLVIKEVDRCGDLLALAKAGNHIKEKYPASWLIWVLTEVKLFQVAKIWL
jgi:hypothetical protein